MDLGKKPLTKPADLAFVVRNCFQEFLFRLRMKLQLHPFSRERAFLKTWLPGMVLSFFSRIS